MRKLMWFVIDVGVGCAAIFYLPSPLCLWLLGAAILGAAAILIWKRKTKGFLPGCILLAGLVFGAGWTAAYGLITITPSGEWDRQEVEAEIIARDYSRESDYGITVEADMSLSGRTYRVITYLQEVEQLAPGDRLSGQFYLQHTKNHSSADYYLSEGIYFLVYQEDELTFHKAEKTALRDYPVYLRHSVITAMDKTFPKDTAAFAKALLLGDTSGFDYATNTALKISGIAHVVAVSGLHISILFSFLYFLTLHRKWASFLIAIPVMVLFAAMTGFTPSVVRACVMLTLMRLSLLVKKEYDAPTALSFAVLLLLILNPYTIASIGFQLSVGSVAGILLFYGGLRSWFGEKKWFGDIQGRKLKNKLSKTVTESVCITLSAQVFTAPLCALYFSTVSLVGVLTNLLTLWLVTCVFCGILISCVLSVLWLPAAMVCAWIVSWPIRFILAVAKLLSALPFAAVYTQSPWIVVWLVLVYVFLWMFLLQKEKRPEIFLCCSVLCLCVALLGSWCRPSFGITVLDVGEGQCILLEGDGRTYMVDCGGSYDAGTADLAAQTLLSRGISRLDGLIFTHFDRDHADAASLLLTRIGVDSIIVPAVTDPEHSYDKWIPEEYRDKIMIADKDLSLSWESTTLSVFAENQWISSNESGLCILFQRQDCDILITGDRSVEGEQRLLQKTGLPQVDVLVAGHHGAADSTGTALLEAVRPQLVLISAGENRYKHPSGELLLRLSQFGIKYYCTKMNGTITIGW